MRYALLVLLNLPIIIFALINFTTQYKLKKIDKSRYRRQLIVLITAFIVLVGSFPIYNLLMGRPILQSNTLNLLDIAQTTAIVYIIYAANTLRRKSEQNEHLIRDLHQELSIKLSSEKND